MKTQTDSFEYMKYNNQDIWAYGFKLSNDSNRVILKLPPTFGRIENNKFIVGKKKRNAFDLHFATTKEEATKEYNYLIATYAEHLLQLAQHLETYFISDSNSPVTDYNIPLKLTNRFTLSACNTELPNTSKYGFTIDLTDTTAPDYATDLVYVHFDPDTHELTIETWPDNPESDKHHIINIIIPEN